MDLINLYAVTTSEIIQTIIVSIALYVAFETIIKKRKKL